MVLCMLCTLSEARPTVCCGAEFGWEQLPCWHHLWHWVEGAEGLHILYRGNFFAQIMGTQRVCLRKSFAAVQCTPSPVALLTAAPAPPAPHCSEIARRREAGTLPQPPPPAKGMSPEQAAEALAVGASHPTWLVAGWLQQYGPKATMELLRWNNR